ncbi:MAG: hypothetical protein Q8P87_00120 [bacterium]|nr:hypothetical protein [bacterium]
MVLGYLLSIILLINLVFVGLLITYFLRLEFFLEARVAAGALIGIIIFGVSMLVVSYFLGLNFLGLTIFVVIINFFSIKYLLKENIWKIQAEWLDLKRRFSKLSWKLFFLFLGVFTPIFSYLAFQLLTFSNGRYFVQPLHAYGDISLHLGLISSFAFGNNFPPQSPILSGTKISYPFLIDFITAIFVNPLSLRFDQAIALVGVLMMAVSIILLAYFSLKVTGNKLAACLVLVLFFFNGGLGFLYFLNDLQISNLNFFQFIQVLPRDYTALKDLGYFWINVVISMFLPQRSFLLGLPVSLLILYIFWDLSERFDARKLFLGILLTSFLPIIHAHSLIALAPFLLWLTTRIILRNKKKLSIILIFGFIGMAIIFLLSKIFLEQSENPFSLMKYKLGWMAPKGEVLSFYIKNFGFNLLLIPAAILLGLKKHRKLAYFALIGQLWFILPSLFIFQPWDFDNTKFFIYWYLSSLFILAYLLSKLILTRQVTYVILAITAIYLLSLAGFLDITRLITSSGTKYESYSPQAIKLAEFVKSNTKQDAVFLSVDKFNNPVVSLSGRKVLVGYHGWLWTYGLDYRQRETDVRSMLAGQGNQDLFKKYNISHVILFENEQESYVINEDYLNQYPLIYNQDGYKIYQI